MKITGNEPIAPTMYKQIGDNDFRIATTRDLVDGSFITAHGGITIRQQFAMAAMQGIFSNADSLETHAKIANKVGVSHEVVIARCSFDMADAMIEENNRREDNE
jgi:hypothetical protein